MSKRPDAILPPYLPMPYTGARRDEGDYDRYRERRALQLQADPGYDKSWLRPSVAESEAAWELVKDGLPDIDTFLSTLGRKQDDAELATLRARAKQAVVVTIDAAICSGETGRLLTANTIGEALAAAFSDWYRWSLRETPARSSYDMGSIVATDWKLFEPALASIEWFLSTLARKQDEDELAAFVLASLSPRHTYRPAWICRDLLMNGLRLESFVKTAQNDIAGLYRIELSSTPGNFGPHTNYRVLLDAKSSVLQQYRVLRGSDGESSRRRILLTSDPDPKPHDEYEVAAEQKYDIVNPGPLGALTLRRLQAMSLNFHTHAFEDDYARAEQEGAEDTSSLRAIAKEIAALGREGKVPTDGVISIKSGFYMTKNRRYEPSNFWVPAVTGRDHRGEGNISAVANIVVEFVRSRRLRWFSVTLEDGLRYQLRGVDVSSAQIQTLAVFTGDIELEKMCRQRSFWAMAADLAWAMHNDQSTPFKFPDPELARKRPDWLKNSLKHAVMTHIYGQGLGEIAKQLAEPKSSEDFVPLGDEANIEALIYDKHLRLNGLLLNFRPAMQRLAQLAWEQDPYAGVTLTDLLDGTTYRRNPFKLESTRVAGSGVKIYADVPYGSPNDLRDYTVDVGDLIRSIGPCFTHSLDGLFASLVVEQLSLRGIGCVSIHDSWLVAWPHIDRLFAVLPHADLPFEPNAQTVSAVWMQKLGPAYDDLARYLHRDALLRAPRRKSGYTPEETARFEERERLLALKYESWVAEMRAKWERRVEEQKWPRFRYGIVGPEITYVSEGVTFKESLADDAPPTPIIPKFESRKQADEAAVVMIRSTHEVPVSSI
jgi:hypothetical protein